MKSKMFLIFSMLTMLSTNPLRAGSNNTNATGFTKAEIKAQNLALRTENRNTKKAKKKLPPSSFIQPGCHCFCANGTSLNVFQPDSNGVCALTQDYCSDDQAPGCFNASNGCNGNPSCNH